MADASLHDQIVQYLEQKYGSDLAQAEKIWNSLQVPDGARLEDVTFQATQKAVDLGLKPIAGSSNPSEVAAGKQQDAADVAAGQQQQVQSSSQILATAAQQLQEHPDQAATILSNTQQALQSLGLGSSGTTPTQVLQLTGGKDLSTTQLAQAIRVYNAANPNDTLQPTDSDGFYQRILANAPGALDALGRVVEGQTKTTFSIWDPNAKHIKDVPIETNQLVAAAGQGGLKILTPSIAAAERTNGVVPWQVLHAALVKGGQRGLDSAQSDLNREYAFGQTDPGETGPHLASGADVAAQQLQKLTQKYGDPLLALIALRDPALADAIYAQGSTTAEQAQKASQIFLDSGLGSTTGEVVKSLADQGYAANVTKLDAMLTPAGASGATVHLPDPKQLQEAARQMYRAWFVREPTDAELSAFVSDIDGKVVSSAKPGNPFQGVQATQTTTQVDPQSQLTSSLRANPEYAQLFGQKAIGVSEEDYANQFRSAASGLFGGQIPNSDAVRVGMMTGNVEDSLRAQSNDPSAQQNSSWLQRVAQAANAIAAVT